MIVYRCSVCTRMLGGRVYVSRLLRRQLDDHLKVMVELELLTELRQYVGAPGDWAWSLVDDVLSAQAVLLPYELRWDWFDDAAPQPQLRPIDEPGTLAPAWDQPT